ncbi:uncharacterized protein LOC130440652 [Diorhabda sublineata]|uniref:uncharacterized protein LOC130440652 n=1 Tax=Diorhabda sublineata TaxID=1163346 RepID=UPI0024E157CC|nr:uncharacterized protein LOC130440652 [Diorhabda sublineata]
MEIDIEGKCLIILFFADDQVIISGDEDDVNYMLRKFDDEYAKWGLNMNITNRISANRNIISEDGTIKDDIRNRAEQGKKATQILSSLLCSEKINLNRKMTIKKVIVEPILTYECECWQLTDRQKKIIEAVEIDYLRTSCRISRTDLRRRTGRVYMSSERIQIKRLLGWDEDVAEPMVEESIDVTTAE